MPACLHRTLNILIASVVSISALGVPASPASAQCVKETKDVPIGSDVGRFAQYRCTAGGSGAAVNVEFLRLSEVAVSGLLKQDLWPEIKGHLGGVRLADNAVLAETRSLFEKFSKAEDAAFSFYVQSFAPKIGKGTEQASAGEDRRQFAYLTFPNSDGYNWEMLPLPDDSRVIKSTTAWPAGYNFYYGLAFNSEEAARHCKSPADFNCVHLWRPLTSEDIQLFDARFRQEQEIVREELRRDGFDGGQESDTDGSLAEVRGPFPLISHLTKDGWPKDFLTVVGTYSECGGGYGFVYYPRPFVLDVAIIENASSAAADISDLLGSSSAGGLRLAGAAETAEPIGNSIGSLAPGERVLVALRMNFVASRGLRKVFETNLDFARAFYAKIERLPPGAIVGKGSPTGLQKRKEDYRAPAKPYLGAYVYGPELSMTGLVVNGERVLLEERSANFIELTASSGEGSCPYLYARDDETGRWVNYGKVIHAADAPEKIMTEEVPLHSLATHFRIAEEELEVSHIDRVSLLLELKRGQTLIVEPAIDSLKSADQRYVEIAAGQALELSFDLPPGLRAQDVKESRLAITGFYRQHSSLMASGFARQGFSTSASGSPVMRPGE